MKSPEIGWMVCAAAVLTTAVITVGQDTHPQRAVHAREVPVPSTVSSELQRVIAQRVPPTMKMPTTVEGWKEMQREADAEAEKAAVAAAKRLGTNVEATEVAKVKCYRVTPKVVVAGKENHLIVHVHKGAY